MADLDKHLDQQLQAHSENQLLARLSAREQRRFLSLCEPIALAQNDVLCEREEPLRHAWFPAGAAMSVLVPVQGHAGVGVAMLGREGMLGASLLLGAHPAAARVLVHGAGDAWRIGSARFRRELQQGGPLRLWVARYAQVQWAQLHTAAACLHSHPIGQRLARWLLMDSDRHPGGSAHLTHELLATLLGVRRVGVTLAAGDLQRRGLIAYHRGTLTVLDRPGLLSASCACYLSDLSDYDQTLG